MVAFQSIVFDLHFIASLLVMMVNKVSSLLFVYSTSPAYPSK